MKTTNDRATVFSQKAYEKLLKIYPRAYRKEYGPAMAQLFHDLARDAWNEKRTWGLARLWLRVLPDLAKTSFTELLSNLKGEQSMLEMSVGLIRARHAPLVAFTSVFVILFGMAMLITFCTPKSYAGTTRLKLSSSYYPYYGEDSGPINRPSLYYPYYGDIYSGQTTFEIMKSQVVLDKVINDLNLNVEWGKKYASGRTLKTDDTIKLLRKRMVLKCVVPSLNLITVTFYGDDKNEAAQIANEIAATYQKVTASPYFIMQHAGAQAEIIESARPSQCAIEPNVALNLIHGISAGVLFGGMVARITFLLGRSSRAGDASGGGSADHPDTAERVVGVIWAICGGTIFGWCVLGTIVEWLGIPHLGFIDLFAALAIGVPFGFASVCGFLLYRKNPWVRIPLGTISAILASLTMAVFLISCCSGAFALNLNESGLILCAMLLFWFGAAMILLRPTHAKAEIALP